MPNIFEEKPKLLSMGYYEGLNIFGRLFVKCVMEEIDYLENHINVLNSKIESLNDLHQYFWCL
ncbi:MAG: hypothetical protein MJ199_01115, partial [Bacilli bacterium]|nr:hypothetical protein [Bacilli bacterium]